MNIALILVVLNAENELPHILSDIEAQDYPHDKTELLLVDSMSKDGTRAVMEAFAKEAHFARTKVLENSGVILPCGFNTALRDILSDEGGFHADCVIRLDAHSRIPADFVSKNIEKRQAGHSIVGGLVTNFIENPSRMGTLTELAEDSMFGGSAAAFRHQKEEGVVKTLAFACYGREVFEKVGLLNEHLKRTEDNELHYRMREAGFEFFFTPEICSSRATRADFKKLLKQKYLNGYWIGLTMGVCPKCFSLYHFVPLAFVLALLAGVILALCGVFWPLLALLAAYALANLFMSITALISAKYRHISGLLLPFMFFLLHLAYGTGTLIGLIKLPFWMRKNK